MAGFDDVDMNNVEPQDDYAPIPVGEYVAAITASEIVRCGAFAKDPNGRYINLEVTILDGKYKNRKIWANLNLWNANEQAVSIAKREMASIKIATNQPNATDTVAFHNKPVLISVGIKPASGDFEASNNIRGWKQIAKPSATVPQSTQQAAPAVAARPWVAPPAMEFVPAEKDIF